MLTLAFDTATGVATSALVRTAAPAKPAQPSSASQASALRDDDTLGERVSVPGKLLEDVNELLESAGVEPTELSGLVVGTGPGSFTGLRVGLAAARALAFALDLPVAGVSTLDALAAGAPGALPVIDARRREVFTLEGGEPVVLRPEELAAAPGTTCVGDGAVRYRGVLEAAGAEVPPDESELHVPRASLHVSLARDFGAAEAVEPIYVRAPDADRVLQ